MNEIPSQPLGEKEVLEIFAEFGAIITGNHFVYSSGKHGSTYVDKDKIFTHPTEISRLCYSLAVWFADDDVDVVVAPAIGGIALSQRTAYHLGRITGREILAAYAERSEVLILEAKTDTVLTFDSKIYTLPKGQKLTIKEECFIFRRFYRELVSEKRVLVVEDVLNTGGSAKKVVEAVRECGGQVIGVGALCNRGGVKPKDVADVPKLIALANISLESWDSNDCLLCQQGIPIHKK